MIGKSALTPFLLVSAENIDQKLPHVSAVLHSLHMCVDGLIQIVATCL